MRLRPLPVLALALAAACAAPAAHAQAVQWLSGPLFFTPATGFTTGFTTNGDRSSGTGMF